jgi:predicted DNA-binding transcriptional regulator AlpA
MSPCLDAAGRSADVRRLVDAGRAPQPVRLGRSCRWPRAAVETWIAAGCPKIRTVRAGGAK